MPDGRPAGNAGGVECYDASFCAGMALDEMAAESGLRVVRLRQVDILTALGDAGSAARLLGWQPEVTFETTLREVLAISWNLAKQIRK